MPLDQPVISTTQEMAAEFPFNQDMNSRNILGMGAYPTIALQLISSHVLV
jgi:hypothetical protein